MRLLHRRAEHSHQTQCWVCFDPAAAVPNILSHAPPNGSATPSATGTPPIAGCTSGCSGSGLQSPQQDAAGIDKPACRLVVKPFSLLRVRALAVAASEATPCHAAPCSCRHSCLLLCMLCAACVQQGLTWG